MTKILYFDISFLLYSREMASQQFGYEFDLHRYPDLDFWRRIDSEDKSESSTATALISSLVEFKEYFTLVTWVSDFHI